MKLSKMILCGSTLVLAVSVTDAANAYRQHDDISKGHRVVGMHKQHYANKYARYYPYYEGYFYDGQHKHPYGYRHFGGWDNPYIDDPKQIAWQEEYRILGLENEPRYKGYYPLIGYIDDRPYYEGRRGFLWSHEKTRDISGLRGCEQGTA